ncbi:MAG: hypothetical protein ABID09_00900 [Candidatus Omnitrophota bacterium]
MNHSFFLTVILLVFLSAPAYCQSDEEVRDTDVLFENEAFVDEPSLSCMPAGSTKTETEDQEQREETNPEEDEENDIYQPGLLEKVEKEGIIAAQEEKQGSAYDPDPSHLMESKEDERIYDIGRQRDQRSAPIRTRRR